MPKTRILILFGGRSAEHEVSVISARSVYNALDLNRYEVVLVGISRDGRWLFSGNDESILNDKEVVALHANVVDLSVTRGELVKYDGSPVKTGGFDVVFPLLHGTYGEDGTIQGLFELVGVPYVGAGVTASAVGMDKELARAVFSASGLPQTRYIVIQRSRCREDLDSVLQEIESKFDYPLFLKPVNLGSSVGVSKAHDRNQLIQGLRCAGAYDTKIMVEASVEGAREIECAVLGNENPSVSGVGEIIPGAEFYDYTTKYIVDRSKLLIPADLPEATVATVRNMAARAFRAIDGSGLARVDFLLGTNDQMLINEINTMPGFTPISMYPKLWEASGLGLPDLIQQLISLALDRHTERRGLKITL